MVLVVPKAFILNSLLDSKLSDSLFIINSFIMYVISINVKKYQKMTKMLISQSELEVNKVCRTMGEYEPNQYYLHIIPYPSYPSNTEHILFRMLLAINRIRLSCEHQYRIGYHTYQGEHPLMICRNREKRTRA